MVKIKNSEARKKFSNLQRKIYLQRRKDGLIPEPDDLREYLDHMVDCFYLAHCSLMEGRE